MLIIAKQTSNCNRHEVCFFGRLFGPEGQGRTAKAAEDALSLWSMVWCEDATNRFVSLVGVERCSVRLIPVQWDSQPS